MIELNSKIKEALIKIDFIKRYEGLSNKFNAERTPSNNRLVYIDGEETKITEDLNKKIVTSTVYDKNKDKLIETS